MATATLANTRLSLVDGTAFVDFSAAGTLTPYLNGKLTLTDSAGKKAVGYLKAAGTGETFGDPLVSNAAFTSDTTGWSAEGTATIAWDAAPALLLTINGTGGGYKTTGSYDVAGKVVKEEITWTAGTYNGNMFFWRNGVASAKTYNVATSGSASQYYTGVSTSIFGSTRGTAATGTVLYTQYLPRQLLTPSSTGVTITSTRGGSVYNWASVEAGFNYNDASGYTYTISDFLPTTDFLGKPIRGLPDIGAYEFYGGAGQLGMGMIYGY